MTRDSGFPSAKNTVTRLTITEKVKQRLTLILLEAGQLSEHT
jgi:hypothetical protein